MTRPAPSSKELTFDDNHFIVSKTDLKGKIVYGNELFITMSGYSESELLGTPHSILRHPDMPKTVFWKLWDEIQKGNEVFAYVKNLTKIGSFYWVFAQVTPSFDKANKIIGYHSVRRKPGRTQIQALEPIYRQLLNAEKSGGLEAGKQVLNTLLEQKGTPYDEFIFTL
jgi:PAS domain S-box-containing protein